MFDGIADNSLIQLLYSVPLSLIATPPVHNHLCYGNDYHYQYCQYHYDYWHRCYYYYWYSQGLINIDTLDWDIALFPL